VNSKVLGVGEFKYTIGIIRDQRQLLWQPNLSKSQPKLH